MISIDKLHEYFDADLTAGILVWKFRHDAPPEWNSRYAGTLALNSLSNHGYKKGRINYRMIKAHRAIWAMANGHWPDGQIDHINGVRHDNRIANLRVVTNAENAKNQKRRASNTSGIAGVGFHKATRKYKATIRVDGKAVWLGVFPTLEAAAEARLTAAKQHGYSQRGDAILALIREKK